MAEEGQERTLEERIAAVEDALGTLLDMTEDLSKKLTEVDKKTVKKASGLFGGKRTKTAVKDTKTGTIYPSKAATAKALYKEVENGDPGDHFLWYKLIAAFPERFVDAGEEEAKKVWEAEAKVREKEVEESNKKLEAERVAKEAAEAKTKAEAEAKAKK